MDNIQDFIVHSNMFRTFKVDELLFAEFKCPVETGRRAVWCDNNMFVHILNGYSAVETPRQRYPLVAGDSLFVKKGGILIEEEFQEDYCHLMVFVPDEFIRSVTLKHALTLPTVGESCDAVYPFGADTMLRSYFRSLLSYFDRPEPPPGSLLRLKFEELIVSVLCTDGHPGLCNHFAELARSTHAPVRQVMEDNYTMNLGLEEFARLCGRSLTAFKGEFKRVFHTTPGRWLREKRLQRSRYLLETTDRALDDILLESGFENKSHFTRVFKSRYGRTPGKYRQVADRIAHS